MTLEELSYLLASEYGRSSLDALALVEALDCYGLPVDTDHVDRLESLIRVRLGLPAQGV